LDSWPTEYSLREGGIFLGVGILTLLCLVTYVSIGLENRPTPYEREGFLGVQILALLCLVTYVSLGFENRPTP
jgi:hypothetical protein